jgi:integrase
LGQKSENAQMARPKKLPRGIEDVKSTSTPGAGAIRARTRRKDIGGDEHEEQRRWRYTTPDERARAVSEAEAWITATRNAIRYDPHLAEQVNRRQQTAGPTLFDWIRRYLDDMGFLLFLDEDGRYQYAVKEQRDAKGNIIPLIVQKDGAKREADHLLTLLENEATKGLCERRVAAITKHDINAAIRTMSASLKAATIDRRISLIKSIWKHAAVEWDEVVPRDALDFAKMPAAREDEREGRDITMREWTRVMEQRTGVAPNVLAALRFLRWSGCRRSECERFGWENVEHDGDHWYLHFRRTKTKGRREVHRRVPVWDEMWPILAAAWHVQRIEANRMIPFDAPLPTVDELRAVLLADMDRRTAARKIIGPLFDVKADSLTQAWGRLCDAAGVENARVHDLRHTRTSEYIRMCSGSLLEAAALSGHQDVRMLQRYHHAIIEQIAERHTKGSAAAEATAKKAKDDALHAEVETQRLAYVSSRWQRDVAKVRKAHI